mmetsp:Transcript_21658/g.26623  ORF Transcript_21658/g.26623 Transcript_21658/m.26623 type:complete len:88 (+) Transcript_21658:365-628(+)
MLAMQTPQYGGETAPTMGVLNPVPVRSSLNVPVMSAIINGQQSYYVPVNAETSERLLVQQFENKSINEVSGVPLVDSSAMSPLAMAP